MAVADSIRKVSFILATTLIGFCSMDGNAMRDPRSAAVAPRLKAQLRQPGALALTQDGKWLFVGNLRSGSISTIDTATLQVADEVSVGRRISDLAISRDGRYLLATDESLNELILQTRQEGTLHIVQRLPVSAAPVSVQITSDCSQAFVASLWSRRLSIVDLPASGANDRAMHVRKIIDLTFAPRKQLLIADSAKLVVADSFGGRLALVDVQSGVVESVRTLPAHNMRGLALLSPSPPISKAPRPLPSGERVGARGERLIIAHQMLNSLATSTRDDIHWGNLITNNLRMLALKDVTAPQADLLSGGSLYYLGGVGHGAGDPSGIAVVLGGKIVVALAGAGEVALGPEPEGSWRRLKVGTRPTAVVASSDGGRAYVADSSGDRVYVADLGAGKVVGEVSLGPKPELTPSQRGEQLFYDARLSHDGWFSCHSCHTDGHTTGLLNDNQSDGSLGTPKRILSLLGVGDTGPWAWNGGMATLEKQIQQSIQSTMQGPAPSAEHVRDLVAFLKTLPAPPPLNRQGAGVGRGRQVFARKGCETCHVPPTYTSAQTYDVGLKDEAGATAFNPPSLRGISQGSPYFHDGRAATLEDVFARYRHQIKGELNGQELNDLLSFLRSI